MSGDSEYEAIEINAVPVRAAMLAVCVHCGSQLKASWQRTGDPDPDEVPDAEQVCERCTAECRGGAAACGIEHPPGVPHVYRVYFAGGEHRAAFDEALDRAEEDDADEANAAELDEEGEVGSDDPGAEAREPTSEDL